MHSGSKGQIDADRGNSKSGRLGGLNSEDMRARKQRVKEKPGGRAAP